MWVTTPHIGGAEQLLLQWGLGCMRYTGSVQSKNAAASGNRTHTGMSGRSEEGRVEDEASGPNRSRLGELQRFMDGRHHGLASSAQFSPYSTALCGSPLHI